jgi:hypothetical protein
MSGSVEGAKQARGAMAMGAKVISVSAAIFSLVDIGQGIYDYTNDVAN